MIVTDPFYLDAGIFDGMTELTKNQKLERDIYAQRGFSVDDFTLKTYPGTHDNRAFQEGRFQRPSDPRTLYDGTEGFGIPCPSMLGSLGSIFNLRLRHRIRGYAGRIFNPEPYRWYHICTSIISKG